MSGRFVRKSSRPSRSQRSVQPALENLEERSVPATLQVGAGLTYTTIAQAAAAAQNGDTIQIQAGTYTSQEAVFTQSNLTIQGVGGAVIFNDNGYQLQNQKGIFDIRGNNDTVQGITFEYAHDMSGAAGDNFAGIRGEGNTLTIKNCTFLHNDDGILINNDPNFATDNNNLLVTNSEFGYNGYGDGQSHNMYIGEITSFTLEYSYSHDANQGHLVKSRALNTYLLYNDIADGSTGGGSSEIDIPYGGNSYLIGNIIEKDAAAANHNFLTYDLENGPSTYAQKLYAVNNTFVNDYGGGTYVVGNSSNPPSILLENNIFAGGGTLSSVASTNVTNLATNSPGFVSWNPSTIGGNYQLAAGSAAIGAGTQPGSANGFSLVPTQEYLAPESSMARPVETPIDIGAYAYGVAPSLPAAPTGLTATAGNAQVALTWSASSGASSYNVYRGTSSGGETLLASGVTATSYTSSGLTNGTTYFYQVTAVNSAGESGKSNEVSARPQVPAPAVPTGLTATAGNAQVALSWSAASGATSYNLYRSTTSGGETLLKSGITATSYTDTGLTNGTSYYYQVTAVNAGGESGRSSQASATPQAPKTSAGSATFVKNDAATQGSWGNAYGADGYDISQSAASFPSYATVSISGNANYTWNGSTTDPRALLVSGSTNRIAACWYSGSSFTIDVNITDGQTHQVALYALDWDSYGPRQEQINVIDPGTGNVLNSQTVSNFNGGQYLVYNVSGHVQFQITNLVGGSNAVISGLFFGGKAVPANPTGLTATAGNAQVALSWAATSGATSYNLYRSTTSGGETLLASGLTATSYTDSGLTNGTTYYYEVAAVNNAGASGLSSQVSATPQAPATLPSPWKDADIGSPGLAGSASYTNGTFTVNGGGSDIWNASDQFNYTYQAVSGNETIIARVASQQNTDPWAKAGVMVRDSLNANGADAFVATTPGNGTIFQYRTADGASAQWNGQVSASAPEWVKLVINGGTITGYASPDGSTWTQIGTTTLPLGSTYYVGLADTAHNNGLISTATFTNVSVTSQSGPVVGTGTGLTGQYYSGTSFNNLVVTRTDPTVNFTWANDTAPVSGLPADNWSVKWTGQVQAQYSQAYTFTTVSDDGVRLYVNGQLVINDWAYHGATADSSAPIQLVAGQKYSIEMDYFEGSGAATAQLRWSSASTPAGAIPTSQLYAAKTSAAVNLAGSFNRTAIVTDGTTFSNGGLDGDGSALSAALLGSSVNWGGQTFSLGAANSANAISAQGQTVALPQGNYSSLMLLADGVNGNQANLTFTVTYTDGTTQTITQSFSDWYTPQNYAGESVAVSNSYRNLSNGTKQNGPFNVYGYKFSLNSGKVVKSITLPNDGNLEILAMNLVM